MNSKDIEFKDVYCIGDSHISLFTNEANFISHSKEFHKWKNFYVKNVGPYLAFDLFDLNDKTTFWNTIKEVPEGGNIILLFGEIDCKTLHKKIGDRSVVNVIDELVSKYMQVFFKIKNMGYNIIGCSIPPELVEEPFSSFYNEDAKRRESFDAHSGSLNDRKNYKHMFNENTRLECEKNEIKFINLYDCLIDENGIGEKKYYLDDIHLNPQKVKIILFRKLIENGILF